MNDRSRTLIALLLTIVGLTLVLTVTVAIQRLAPTVDTDHLAVELPPDPMALDPELSTCRRTHLEATAELLRDQVIRGGRVTSAMVIGCPAAYDGVAVTYVGEVVGDLLPRRGGSWALVNDDDYALVTGPLPAHGVSRGGNSGLSVWFPDPVHEALTPGVPGRRGDVVRVEGVVMQADPADGGGLTVRATDLQVLAHTVELTAPLHVPQAIAAALASLAALAAAIGLWRSRTR